MCSACVLLGSVESGPTWTSESKKHVDFVPFPTDVFHTTENESSGNESSESESPEKESLTERVRNAVIK